MEAFSALLALCAGNSPVPVNSTHKGQWRGALMFSLICARINDWVNNLEAGDLRRRLGHCDVIVMYWNVYMVTTKVNLPVCICFGSAVPVILAELILENTIRPIPNRWSIFGTLPCVYIHMVVFILEQKNSIAHSKCLYVIQFAYMRCSPCTGWYLPGM